MMEVTAQGRQANADMVKGQRADKDATTRYDGGVPSASMKTPDAGELSERAATVALDTGRESAHAKDCGCAKCKPDMAHKRLTPDTAGMMKPGAIAASAFTRGYLGEGHSAPSNQQGPERQPAAPATLRVTGEGPVVDTLLSRGGRSMMREAPRPDAA